ncbi:hypothetical protein B0H16DRAFT_1742624 [Mycena metata]|uniref:Protein kinase domain-containing protein n=1 Tax=Mycena metata TaxID=1033252 RepID=A0AAD7H7P4_9AGAR|nr:hypothetical protein B0H16DRAFT_1742624 [Mycena metata]
MHPPTSHNDWILICDVDFSAGGTFFTGSQGFTIKNSIFNNVTHTAASTTPPDIHRITMGDIELRSQLRVDSEWRIDEDTGIVRRERRGGCIRRVYSAKVGHRKMTVVMFEGDSAEQEWQQNITTYLGLRHPNILQIYGVANSGSIHATLFHGDLMLLEEFLDLHEHYSPILQVYLTASAVEQSGRADDYFASQFGWRLIYGEYTVWIQLSTGTISAELGVPDYFIVPWGWRSADPMTIQNPAYHQTCSMLSSVHGSAHLSIFASVTLGAMVFWPPLRQPASCIDNSTFEPGVQLPFEDCIELASVDHIEVDSSGWFGSGVVMTNGWTRLFPHSFYPIVAHLTFRVRKQDILAWLSQANHIFKCLQITSNFSDHVLLSTISIHLQIQPILETIPTGYLFLCPPNHFRTGSASFTSPDYPAYWSLDSSVVERLSAEEAMHLGFPSFEFKSRVSGLYWEDKIYAGLRQFHASKGFDPDNQDLACHLGYPLYRLSTHGRIQEETPTVSRTFNLWMNLQLGLILFILVYQAYETVV